MADTIKNKEIGFVKTSAGFWVLTLPVNTTMTQKDTIIADWKECWNQLCLESPPLMMLPYGCILQHLPNGII